MAAATAPAGKKKKKRWHGEMTRDGLKSALGIKRKPNRKDRERARAKLGLPDPATTDRPFDAGKPPRSNEHGAGNAAGQTKQPDKTARGGGGEVAGAKRRLGDGGSTVLDRGGKKRQRLAAPAAPAASAAPVTPAAPKIETSVPKTEKAQKLQELLRQKLSKAGQGNAAVHAGAQAAQEVREHKLPACSQPDEAARSSAQGLEETVAPREVTVTVVQGKVTAGKVSSNWMALKRDLKKERRLAEKGKTKPESMKTKLAVSSGGYVLPSELELINCQGPLGIDCEMVGVGEGGHRSILARVSIVDAKGDTIMDTFVAPQEKVTDYRTRVSGVRPADLKGAPSFQHVQALVSVATKNKILVGHSLQHDLNALMLTHQKHLIRDTAKYRPYQNAAKKPRKLRDLAKEMLGISIQENAAARGGEHSSVEDARASLLLYKLASTAWEKELAAKAAKLEGRRDKRAKKGGGLDLERRRV